MAKPISITFTFQTQTGPIPLSQLDADLALISTAINDFATYSNYLADSSGTANQITATIPAGTTFAYAAGVALQVLLANTNTASAVNINVGGLGNQLVLNNDGTAPAIGQLTAGMFLNLQYNGTAFLLTGAASKAAAFGAVTSITGTANQIAASASSGAVTLSFPSPVIIPAPTSGEALVVNALNGSGTFNATIKGGTTTGDAGLLIEAGNGATDLALNIANALNTIRLLALFGDGGLVLGNPTGGDKGLGTGNFTALYVNGAAVSPGAGASTGTFTATTTGLSGATMPCSWTLAGNSVTLFVGAATGSTGTGTAFAITNLPSAIQPATAKFASCAIIATNNSGLILTLTANVAGSSINFGVNGNISGWVVGQRALGQIGGSSNVFVWDIT
jgi:hypothetical protein